AAALSLVVVPIMPEVLEKLSDVAEAAPSTGVVNVGDEARTTAPVPVLAVAATPLIEKLLPVPAVSNVLLVSVSVVARPTNVSVAEGRVSVPEAVAATASLVEPEVAP